MQAEATAVKEVSQAFWAKRTIEVIIPLEAANTLQEASQEDCKLESSIQIVVSVIDTKTGREIAIPADWIRRSMFEDLIVQDLIGF
jgi:hypothetical protein